MATLSRINVVDNPDQILVALQDGAIFDALLVGSDPLTDLAVLKIDADNLPVIPINTQRSLMLVMSYSLLVTLIT